MYVDELQGPWLDYWVARAERLDADLEMPSSAQPTHRFSTERALAQPIIDREHIVVGIIHDAQFGTQAIACVGTSAPYGVKSEDGRYWMGDSELQAAMRCYVGITFGPVVV